ncbi:uncharacterized protein [Macaca nemestrina]|uniref:uncharacterized protein n=1 Tax=Macaca nemestrina TaxID=9545 RepID=UPI0039B93345
MLTSQRQPPLPGDESLRLREGGAFCGSASDSGLRPVLTRASIGWYPEASILGGSTRRKKPQAERLEAAQDPRLRPARTVCCVVGEVSRGTRLDITDRLPIVCYAHSICSRGTSVPRVVTLDPSRTRLWLSLPMSREAASGCRNPRDLEIKGGRSSTKEGGQRMAHGSVHFQATARLAALGISLCPSETLPASLHCNPIPDDPVGSIIRWGEKSAQPRRHLEAPPAPGTEAEERSRSSGRQDYYGSDPGLPQAPLAVLFPPSASGCPAIAAATAATATATATGGSVPAAAASPPCFKGSAA